MEKKLFDYVIGNPPYQEQNNKNGRQPPIYHIFMDSVEDIASVVELITPARFLFNVGQTPKAWNAKKLSDEHFKVLEYYEDASEVFPTTTIKGGVAISLRDSKKEYGAIKLFARFDELEPVINKTFSQTEKTKRLDSIISPRGNYRTSEAFFKDFPYASSRLGEGTGNMIVSNFFEKLPEVNMDGKAHQDDSVKLLARVDNKRTFCYLQRRYLFDNDFLPYYNVICPKSNGTGQFGEVITSTEILKPNEGTTDTFISIGQFQTLIEAQNLQKYFSTKYFRAMLGVFKVTQDNPKSVWAAIPLQDFTPDSDIDWSKSIREIDQQLYRKYNLDEKDITFIETHVKEMA